MPDEPEHEVLQEHGEVLAWNLRRRSMRRTKVAKERADFFMQGPSFTRAQVHEVAYWKQTLLWELEKKRKSEWEKKRNYLK